MAIKKHNYICLFVLFSIIVFQGCTVYIPSYITRLTYINTDNVARNYSPVGSTNPKSVVTISKTIATVLLFTEDIQPSFNRRINAKISDTLHPIVTSNCSNFNSKKDNKKVLSTEYACVGDTSGIGIFKGNHSMIFVGKRGMLSCQVVDTANSLLYIFDIEKKE